MEKDYNEMLEVIAENDRLCDCCRLAYEGCAKGVTGGPNGPIFPACADRDANFESGLFEEDDIIEVYDEITGEG